VEIEFLLLVDGNIKNIKMLSGKSIFQKSTTQAISSSFPINVEHALFDFPKKFKIKISYILN